MSVLSVNKNNFDSVKTSTKPVLLDFYADWCGPCRMVSPLVDEIAEENPQYLIGKINVDNEPELASAFGVASIPLWLSSRTERLPTSQPALSRRIKSLLYLAEKLR